MSTSDNQVIVGNYIFRYADHLSANGHVRPMLERASVTAAIAAVEITSQYVMPTIMQTNNGSKFIGE